jgi:FlaA1/EpsC-like NDP-sugar epimerase
MLAKFLRLYSNRFVSRWLVLFIDLSIVLAAFQLAVVVRLNFDLTAIDLELAFRQSLVVVAFYLMGFLVFQSFSGVVRHSGVEDAVKLVKAAVLAVVGLVVTNLAAFKYFGTVEHTLVVPVSVMAVHFGFATFLLVSSRFVFKTVYNSLFDRGRNKANVLIYGAGTSGMITKQSFTQDNHQVQGFHVIGFIDDNPSKQGKVIQGVKVYPPSILKSDFIERKEVSEVILSIQNISNNRKREIVDLCLVHNIRVKSVPPIEKWINGELTSQQIRDVKIEDLLQQTRQRQCSPRDL